MKFFDYIRFGLKNIWRQKIRTFLTIFAVMIGATSVVLMLTIIFGAKQAAINQIESSGALTQITVSSDTSISADRVFDTGGGSSADSIKLTDALLAKIAALPHVTEAYAQIGVYSLQSGTLEGGDGKAINLNQTIGVPYTATKSIPLAAGRVLAANDSAALIIGQDVLQKLGFKGNAEGIIGKKINFKVQGYVGDNIPPQPSFGPNNQPPNEQEQFFTVSVPIVGVMSESPYDYNSFVPQAWAIKMMTRNQWQMKDQGQQSQDYCKNKPNCSPPPPVFTLEKNSPLDQQGYSNFVVKADELANVDEVAAKIKTFNLGVATAKAIIDQILQVFKLVSIVFGAIGGIALLVAAIGVINTMVMATLERTREIGVMRACGATKAAVRRLFTFEAALLGFWGGVIGCGIAYGLMKAVAHFAGSSLSRQGVPLSVLDIPLWLALTTIAATTVIGLLAGYGPAIRASRMNPVEALRWE